MRHAAQPEITQRDLRSRSKEIMDAVQRGQSFTVTRDGHRIGELIPLRAPAVRSALGVHRHARHGVGRLRRRSGPTEAATAEQETDDPYAR